MLAGKYSWTFLNSFYLLRKIHMNEHGMQFARVIIYTVFAALTLLLIWPFFAPLVLGAITASIFIKLKYTLPKPLQKYKNTYAASSTAVTLLVIIIPLIAIAVLLGFEAFHFTQFIAGVLSAHGPTGLLGAINGMEDSLADILSPMGITLEVGSFNASVLGLLENTSQLLYANALGILSNLASLAINVFFFLFISFFLIRDGEVIIEYVKTLLPFDRKDSQRLVDSVEHVGQTVIIGSIAASFVLGLLMGIVFALFGFQSPVLWGMCIALLSMVPLVGTWLIYIPSIIFLALTSPWYVPLGFFLCILVIENFLFYAVIRPKFLDEKTHLYPLAIFLAIIGGLTWFGPIGIVYGPLLMTITITLVRHALLLEEGQKR